MKLFSSILTLGLLMTCLAGAVERNLDGGFAMKQPDHSLELMVGDASVQLVTYQSRESGAPGKVLVQANGPEIFQFYMSLSKEYATNEPSQVLTFPDRQIIYARGVSCQRIFSKSSWDSVENGDLTPNPSDTYSCRFLMNLRTGQTSSVGMLEPRPRIGVSN